MAVLVLSMARFTDRCDRVDLGDSGINALSISLALVLGFFFVKWKDFILEKASIFGDSEFSSCCFSSVKVFCCSIFPCDLLSLLYCSRLCDEEKWDC